jgi:hypothetical protein
LLFIILTQEDQKDSGSLAKKESADVIEVKEKKTRSKFIATFSVRWRQEDRSKRAATV